MPVIVDEWKSRVMDMYRSRYGEKLDEKKLEKKLNLIIKERFKDPKATLVNNYVNKCVRCNISTKDSFFRHNQLSLVEMAVYS